MEQVLEKLGGLLLGSVPTIVIFLLLFLAYRFLVHSRLAQILEERHRRTEGAMQKALVDAASAEARTAEYEQRLREQKAAVYRAQEARRQQAQQVREGILAEARQHAEALVKQARAEIDGDLAAARLQLQSQGDALAQEVIQTILRPAIAAGGRE